VTGPAWLAHGHVRLALHQLGDGDGRPLLLLHGLGERTPDALPRYLAAWPGPVHGLDFTGHGASTVPAGGGYTAEVLMADADAALAHLGPCTLVGRGLGGYVALLVAGARPALVRGAIVTDGPGLTGGGSGPSSSAPAFPGPTPEAAVPPDPFAVAELSRDVRPPDYATSFARLALLRSELDTPLCVAAVGRPEWLAAVAAEPGVVEESLPQALRRYAG
jgi:pimeloyl-ACP methyl ester carboxylesterase